MNRLQLRALLDDVQSGALTPETAQDQLLQILRQSPFEDIGFARVDHHRSVRQGFPEVVFGQGKTPQQIAAISERIVAATHNLLVTRTTADAYEVVRKTLPGAIFLTAIALLPILISDMINVPFRFGGTSLLIVVGVGLDTVQVVQQQLLIRKYDGFMKKGARVRFRDRA